MYKSLHRTIKLVTRALLFIELIPLQKKQCMIQINAEKEHFLHWLQLYSSDI